MSLTFLELGDLGLSADAGLSMVGFRALNSTLFVGARGLVAYKLTSSLLCMLTLDCVPKRVSSQLKASWLFL